MPSEKPGQARAVGPGELQEVQQIQVQGLAPESWQPLQSVQAGGCKDEAQSCLKGPEATGGWQAGHEPAMYPRSPESQPYPELHQKKCGQQG